MINDLEEITAEEGQQLADQLKSIYFESNLTNQAQIDRIYHEIVKQSKEEMW